jgi:hypothetical protein
LVKRRRRMKRRDFLKRLATVTAALAAAPLVATAKSTAVPAAVAAEVAPVVLPKISLVGPHELCDFSTLHAWEAAVLAAPPGKYQARWWPGESAPVREEEA